MAAIIVKLVECTQTDAGIIRLKDMQSWWTVNCNEALEISETSKYICLLNNPRESISLLFQTTSTLSE